MVVKRISAKQTHPLRHSVLRGGQGDLVVSFEGDEAPGSIHLGIFDDQ